MPVQLLLLHVKRYQVLLLFWAILFATVQGSLLHRFGAHILFLYPEYLGEVNPISTALVGAAFGVFTMCWNITTFILHSRYFKFLAATTQPFLKYCINNAVIPLLFLGYYLIALARFARGQELLGYLQVAGLVAGLLLGFILVIGLGFTYFFGADRTIYRFMSATAKAQLQLDKHWLVSNRRRYRPDELRIDWYLGATLQLRKPRHVEHYTHAFIERIFTQHHLAAIFSVLLIFVLLIVAGYLQDYTLFQLPAASSIMVFFAILIAIAGAISHFLRAWAIAFVAVVFLVLNGPYHLNGLDPRNKAGGLEYKGPNKGPLYNPQTLNQLANPAAITEDSLAFIKILEAWKAKQPEEKPVFAMLCVSGGGSRAATFSTEVMRQLDSLSKGALMQRCFLISGASGGMLGAAWYRELYLRKQQGLINQLYANRHIERISMDLLNPVFSSFVTRDLMAPAQYFNYQGHRYIKDRGYAFEKSLHENTLAWMDKPIKAYEEAERQSKAPVMLLNAVVNRDGRQLVMATRPMRFMMRPARLPGLTQLGNADAIDFQSFFANHQPGQLRFSTALRMNASFPYILPNVWLPTNPVIDVMDAGFRDNTGLETAMRFASFFKQWLQQNCRGVVLLQIRDKPEGGWDSPYESESILDLVTRPALLTQNNLFRFQEYAQLRQYEALCQQWNGPFERVVFIYRPGKPQLAASMSFHLTQREKKELRQAIFSPENQAALKRALSHLRPDTPGHQQAQAMGQHAE